MEELYFSNTNVLIFVFLTESTIYFYAFIYELYFIYKCLLISNFG
jgi:hypothetical protein